MKKTSVYLQYILPQYLITLIMGCLAEVRIPWLKNYFIRRFIRRYHLDMLEAEIEDPTHYPTFNSFFVRQLKATLRPIANGQDEIASPVDGAIAQIGQINQNQLLQVKNFYFDLESLLGGDAELASHFYDGSFATLYLAPHNYHRVHMPLSGELEKTIYVPGKLFSVNQITSSYIPNLYSRNERMIAIFKTDAGLMAVILVGAIIVGSIQTVFSPSTNRSKNIITTSYTRSIFLPTGAELGQFKLGSTVIVLFGKDKIKWNASLNSGSSVQFGQLIGMSAHAPRMTTY